MLDTPSKEQEIRIYSYKTVQVSLSSKGTLLRASAHPCAEPERREESPVAGKAGVRILYLEWTLGWD